MIEKATEWNKRMDAWQRRGGTPRWMLYMNVLSFVRLFPAIVLTFAILWVFGTYWPGDPNLMLKWVGILAIFWWSANRVGNLYSRIQRRDEGGS